MMGGDSHGPHLQALCAICKMRKQTKQTCTARVAKGDAGKVHAKTREMQMQPLSFSTQAKSKQGGLLPPPQPFIPPAAPSRLEVGDFLKKRVEIGRQTKWFFWSWGLGILQRFAENGVQPAANRTPWPLKRRRLSRVQQNFRTQRNASCEICKLQISSALTCLPHQANVLMELKKRTGRKTADGSTAKQPSSMPTPAGPEACDGDSVAAVQVPAESIQEVSTVSVSLVYPFMRGAFGSITKREKKRHLLPLAGRTNNFSLNNFNPFGSALTQDAPAQVFVDDMLGGTLLLSLAGVTQARCGVVWWDPHQGLIAGNW